MPLRPRSKIIAFNVSTQEQPTDWATLDDAHAAAETHRLLLVAAGDAWATPGAYPNSGPHDQYQGKAAGLYIGLETPSLSDPAGTERINYIGEYWFGPP